MDVKITNVKLFHEYGVGFALQAHVDSVGVAASLRDLIRSADAFRCKLTEWRDSRSLDANAYAWVLIGKIAEATKIPRTDVYRNHVRELGGNTDTVCVREKGAAKLMECWAKNGIGWISETMPSKIPGCVNVMLYYGSSTYDSKQMSRLIDNLIQDARELGIETLTPKDLERMMQEWK